MGIYDEPEDFPEAGYPEVFHMACPSCGAPSRGLVFEGAGILWCSGECGVHLYGPKGFEFPLTRVSTAVPNWLEGAY